MEPCPEMPPGSLKIFKKTEPEVWTYIGSAFWIDQYIVTAGHVVSEPGLYRIVPMSDTKKWVEIPHDRFDVLDDADVAYTVIKQRYVDVLGTKKMQPLTRVEGSHNVQIAAKGYKSFGILTPHPDLLGHVYYGASTMKGFSGAPYLMNKKVVAMHVGAAGKQGLGLSITFIQALIRRNENLKKVVPEDSADELYERIVKTLKQKGIKAKYRVGGSADDAQVEFEGKYYFFDTQDLDDRYFESVTRATLVVDKEFADYEETPTEVQSKNCMRAPLEPVVVGNGKQKIVVDVHRPHSSKPIEHQQKNCPAEIQMSLDGLMSMVVQQNAVLVDTLKFMREQAEVGKLIPKKKSSSEVSDLRNSKVGDILSPIISMDTLRQNSPAQSLI